MASGTKTRSRRKKTAPAAAAPPPLREAAPAPLALPSDVGVPPPTFPRVPGRGEHREPPPAWAQDAMATAVAGELPPVSRPGEPSAHPGRPPVPPYPSFAESYIGDNFIGRPCANPALYRAPARDVGGAEADMCAGCDVDCCTNHVIPVNCHDAWAIRSALNLPFKDFLGLVPHSKASPTHHVRIGTGRFQLMLRRRSDKACQFLVRAGGERRCGVHAVRPDACRIFPFVADLELQQQQPGHSLVQLHPSRCPWLWPSTASRKAAVLQWTKDNLEHRQLDRAVLSDWFWAMGVEKTVGNFFEFLEEELSRRMLHPDAPSRYTTRLW